MPALGIGGYYGHSDDELRKEVQFFLDQGFRGMKFKSGFDQPLACECLRVRRAPGHLEPLRALDLGVIEPHERQEARAIWPR